MCARLNVCVHMDHIHTRPHREQMILDRLELDVETVVNYHVGVWELNLAPLREQ